MLLTQDRDSFKAGQVPEVVMAFPWLLVCCCCGVGNFALLGFVGDKEGTTPLDTVYRAVFIEFPRRLRASVQATFGTVPLSLWDNFVDYLVHSNNPLAQILYLLLTVGGYTAFIYYGYPLLPNSIMEEYHKWTSLGLMMACLFTFVAASISDPGGCP